MNYSIQQISRSMAYVILFSEEGDDPLVSRSIHSVWTNQAAAAWVLCDLIKAADGYTYWIESTRLGSAKRLGELKGVKRL